MLSNQHSANSIQSFNYCTSCTNEIAGLAILRRFAECFRLSAER